LLSIPGKRFLRGQGWGLASGVVGLEVTLWFFFFFLEDLTFQATPLVQLICVQIVSSFLFPIFKMDGKG
jgi:hypothetical protein